jgi:hypothetical protein
LRGPCLAVTGIVHLDYEGRTHEDHSHEFRRR